MAVNTPSTNKPHKTVFRPKPNEFSLLVKTSMRYFQLLQTRTQVAMLN
jgi:hypothetical protein